MSSLGSPAGKKGDLEVTIFEARNVNCNGHAVYCSAELISRTHPSTKAQHTATNKDLKWNQTINLDLMSLDGEELVIKLFYKRTTKKDKFLGQSQVPISALSLSKEPDWYYLTDRPEAELKKKPPTELKRSRSITQAVFKRKDKLIVTGEIYYKLNFVHRLIKAKSKIMGSPPAAPPALKPANRLINGSPSVSSRYINMKNEAAAAAAASGATTPDGHEHHGEHHHEHHDHHGSNEESNDESPADLSITEEVIIDEALKEKQKMVKDKLETGERIVRNMTSRIAKMEQEEGEEATREEKAKLEQIKREIKELEKMLESTQNEPHVSVGLSRFFQGANARDARKSVRYSMAVNNYRASMAFNRAPPALNLKSDVAAANSKWDAPQPSARPRTRTVTIATPRQDSFLETHPPQTSPRPVTTVITPPSTPPPNLTPPLSSLRHVPPAKPIPPIPPASPITEPEKFDNVNEEVRYLRMKVSLLMQNNHVLVQEVSRLERDLARYHKEDELREREAKVREREERLLSIEHRSPRRANSADESEDKREGSPLEGDLDESMEGLELSPRMKVDDEKYDMIVAKLEKLDKLDELLRKLDGMKMGGPGGTSSADLTDGGRGYAELKAELEAIQAIIMDETGKYTEKQKEEANINYEKVAQEFQRTPEYKREVAAALEERRKKNEPLNKAALERMIKVYTVENMRDDPELKEKVQKNPELTLIGMDPKMILAKHQNDFQQYMLRNLNLDELRAIRASLPKFRNDQKRQVDWVEALENKIETVSKDPPKPPVKKAAAIKIKTAPAGGASGDFLAELMAKRKRL